MHGFSHQVFVSATSKQTYYSKDIFGHPYYLKSEAKVCVSLTDRVFTFG